MGNRSPSGPKLRIPSVVKRNTLLLAASQASAGSAMQMVPTLGAIMVVRLLGSASLAGLSFSTLGAARFLVSYPVGKIADAYGRKAGLLLGLHLSLGGALVVGLAMAWTSFPFFLAGMVIFGMGVAAGQQMRVAVADMYPPSRRAEGLGYLLTGSLVGAFGGLALISSAQAASRPLHIESLALTWFFVPLFILPAIVLVLQVRPDPKHIATHLEEYYPGYRPPPQEGSSSLGKVSPITFLRHYPKQVAFVSSFAAQGNMTMMMTMTPLVLSHHGHALPVISLAVAIHVLGMFGLSLPLGKLADKIGRRPILVAGTVLAAGGSLLVPLTPAYWSITAGIFLVGLGWSCVNVAATALIADTTSPLERGRAIGTNDTLSAVPGIILPLISGPVVEFLGFRFLGFIGVGLLVIPFALLMRLREISPGRYYEKGAVPA